MNLQFHFCSLNSRNCTAFWGENARGLQRFFMALFNCLLFNCLNSLVDKMFFGFWEISIRKPVSNRLSYKKI
jgi:hypothetical protein